jgi:DNA-binding SARP family transcriptional activator/TolB-like protein
MSKARRWHELRTLGNADLRSEAGVEVRSVLTQPKRLALLAYIALAAPGQHQRRDRLLAIFWPDFDTDRARAALRDALYFLRRSLGDAVVSRGADEVAIDPDCLAVDAIRFQDALRDGRLADALSAYGGDLLDGFHLPASPDFESWLEDERTRLRELAVDAALQLGDLAGSEDRHADAGHWFRRALDLAPHREAVVLRLLDALDHAGDRAGAVVAGETFTGRLARDLDIAPTAVLAGRLESLRRAAPAPAAVIPPLAGPAAAAQPAPFEPLAAAPPPQARNRARRRPDWRMAVAAGAAVIAVAAGLWWWSVRPESAAPAEADIVILPFTVHGDDNVAFLGEGMIDLLGAKLNGVGGVTAVDPQALMTVLAGMPGRPMDLELGRDVAGRFHARHFVMGSVVQAGTALQVSAYMYDAEGAIVARADAVSPADSGLFSLIDEVARALLAGRFVDEDAPLTGLAAVTTSSLPALRDYVDAERFIRAGDFPAAMTLLERAIAQDSTFALAYYRLSSAADWYGRPEIAEPAARAPMRHRDRLPVSDRAIVTARYEYWFGDAARAEALYRQLTTVQPSDVESWFELGEVLFHGGPWFGAALTQAEPAFRRVLALQPRHVGAMIHLARVAAAQGRSEVVDSLIAAVAAVEPGHGGVIELRALRAALDGVGEHEALAAASAQAEPTAVMAVAERVAAYTGNLRAAERILRGHQYAGATEVERATAYQSLAHMLAGQGRWREARREIEAMERLDPAIGAQLRANLTTSLLVPPASADIAAAASRLTANPPQERAGAPAADPAHFARARRSYQLGLLALAAGQPADRHVEALRAAEGSDDARAFSHNLAATLRVRQLAAGDSLDDALRMLEAEWLPPRKPLMIGWAWTHSHVNARLLRAELLARAGRHDEALAWVDASREDIAGSPLVLPRALLLRAESLDALGRAAEAAGAYRAFLDLWRNADPEMAGPATAARRRLEALE